MKGLPDGWSLADEINLAWQTITHVIESDAAARGEARGDARGEVRGLREALETVLVERYGARSLEIQREVALADMESLPWRQPIALAPLHRGL